MTAISRLLLRGRPSAVSGFVVPIRVDAVDGISSRWARLRAHVFQERDEGVLPAFAHGDTARAVQPELRVVRLIAASTHVPPSAVFRGVFVRPCAAAFLPRTGAEEDELVCLYSFQH